jgi:hypothetical protein
MYFYTGARDRSIGRGKLQIEIILLLKGTISCAPCSASPCRRGILATQTRSRRRLNALFTVGHTHRFSPHANGFILVLAFSLALEVIRARHKFVPTRHRVKTTVTGGGVRDPVAIMCSCNREGVHRSEIATVIFMIGFTGHIPRGKMHG